MATGQLYYKVRFADDPNNPKSSNGITESNFFGKENNIVERAQANYFTKVGIQAPPGTKIVFNNSRTIMVGRTGVYEIEATINHMYIVRLVNYIHQTSNERTLKIQGIDAMQEAEKSWNTYLQGLTVPAIDASDTEWTEFDKAFVARQATYDAAYNNGLKTYLQGLNGIYEQDKTNPYVDVENIIIDYQYE